MAKRKANVGDRVSVKRPVSAYYSGYAGAPVVVLYPGVVGTVGAVDVPPVRGNGPCFYCVDFTGPRFGKSTTWRARVSPDNIVLA